MIIPVILFISIFILIGILAYDGDPEDNLDDIMLAGSIVGLIISIILIIRKRNAANAIFDGATEVYKVLATIEIKQSIRGDADVSYAWFVDDVNYNPPQNVRVIFADTDDAEEFYEKTTGKKPPGFRSALEDVEVIIVMKGSFKKAFSMLAIE